MPRKPKVKIGELLRYAREAANLTQTELGTQTGLSQRFLSDLETDNTRPNLIHLGTIAAVCQCVFTIDAGGVGCELRRDSE